MFNLGDFSMKKTLVALAAFAAVSSFAQSSVTLYGQVGVAYGAQKTTTTVSTVAGAVVTPTTNATVSSSGMRANDISASRWGMRGTEDLGGGMRATFNIESGFNANDGTGFGGGGSIFSRRSVVGIGGGFGEISFGRELTPAVFIAGGYDVDGIETFSTTRHLAHGTGVGGHFRRSNAINYVSNNMGGLVVRAQYAGNSSKAANNLAGGATTTTKAGDSGMGLSANYANGPLSVGFAIDQGKGTTAVSTPASTTGSKYDGWYLGVGYNMGVANLMANFSQVKSQAITTPDLADHATTKQWNIGATVPMGAVTLMASVGRNTLSGSNGAAGVANTRMTGSGTDFMLGANYALSKRTTVYARTGSIDKAGTTSSLNGVRTGTGTMKTTGTVVGLRHVF
jgi:predicted porin